MNMISRRFHAVLDYLSAIFLFAAPWLFHFKVQNVAETVFVMAAVVIVLMSVITNYEGGLVKILPMHVHLNIDILLGLFLIVSPWIFHFKREAVCLPLFIIGFLALFSGVFTNRKSVRRI